MYNFKGIKLTKLSFHGGTFRHPIRLRSKPTGFWIFSLDLESRLGPSGKEEAHYLWQDIDDYYKDQYKEHAAILQSHKIKMFTPNPMRINQIVNIRSYWDKAYNVVRHERYSRVGLHMTDVDHLMDIVQDINDVRFNNFFPTN